MNEYEHFFWDYKCSDENAITKALKQVDLHFLFFS